MKGILVLNINNPLKGFVPLTALSNELMDEVLIHHDKKIKLSNYTRHSQCTYSSMIIETKDSTTLDYVSKRAKILSNTNGEPKFEGEDLGQLFIDVQDEFEHDSNLITNFRNNYVTKLSGNFAASLSYLTLNTRPFIGLINKTTEYDQCINLYIVHDVSASFLLWSSGDIPAVMAAIKKYFPEAQHNAVSMPMDSVLLIQPTFILYKFGVWRDVEKKNDKRIAVDKLSKYLLRKMN